MKKIITLLLILSLLAVALCGCNFGDESLPVEPDMHLNEDSSETMDKSAKPEDDVEADLDVSVSTIKRHVFHVETGEVSIELPDGWEPELADGTGLMIAANTYDLILKPPSNEKTFGIITIGITADGQPISDWDFITYNSSRLAPLLMEAVEDKPEFVEVTVNDGYALYTILTDASLVGTSPAQNEYLYLAVYSARYYSGHLVYATLLTDDTDSECFKIMLDAVASIEASFEPVAGSLSFDDWDRIIASPVYDIDGINLLDHDLSDSEFFTEYEFYSEQLGESISVSITSSGEFYIPDFQDVDSFIWNNGGIGMLYYIVSSTEITENLHNYVDYDIKHLGSDGFFLSAGYPARMSKDGESALFAFNADLNNDPNAIYIYLLQKIPDTEYAVFLLLMLFFDDWSENDVLILEELSEHIGVDLGTYVTW